MPKILVISGAGISAESGIPTFRDANGLWENHSIDQVANYMTWKQNFDLVHRFYNQRRLALGTVQPNAGHKWFADLANRYEVTHVTQNIDDMLERAGHIKVVGPTNPLVHVHGFLTEMRCEACGKVWDIGYTEFKAGEDTCPKCGSKKGVKPNVVFFNENAPMYTYLYRALQNLKDDDLVIISGTMGNVLPINAMLYDAPGKKILNNLEPHISIDESMFDLVVHKPLTKAIGDMDTFVRNHFGY